MSNDVNASPPATSASASATSTTSPVSAGKTIFQIEYSFIGNNKFKRRPKPRLSLTNDTDSIDSDEQSLKTSVYCIRLSRLIKTDNKLARETIKKKFKLKRTRDLIHTICALYDNCLPDIGAQSIYDCICSPKSFTICVLKDDSNENDSEFKEEDSSSVYGSNDDLRTIEESTEYPESIFSKLFSDTEDESDSDSDFPKKIDFTHGLKSYLNKCREGENKKEPLLKNLIAVATIQKTSTFQLPGQDEWVLDLELMSVRPKYRGLNIGKYLINLIQNKNYVGNYDAIVTSSDMEAVKFYEKFGFNVDPILNSKYKFIGDIWTNTTKMCYIPPYCQLIDKNQTKLREAFSLFSQTPLVKPIELIDKEDDTELIAEPQSFDNICVAELTNMENDFKRWQKLMFSAYQSQAQIFFKLKQEITNLKIKLSAKESIIDDLKFQNDLLGKKNNLLKMKMGQSLELEDTETDELANDPFELSPTELEKHAKSPDASVGGVEKADSASDLDKLIADLKVLSKKKTYEEDI